MPEKWTRRKLKTRTNWTLERRGRRETADGQETETARETY